MVKFQFKGLMVPVFTPFTQDKRSINIAVIEKYATYLKQGGVHGVFVNATTGEGTTLRMEERKLLAEEWLRVCRKLGLNMMLAIGGVGIADTIELVEHAEKIGVDAIILMPDLFYKPKIEEDLVDYVKEIAKYTKNLSIYYFHIPEHTGVYLDLLRLYDLLKRNITNFDGIYYRHSNIELATTLLKEGHNIIVATDTILTGVLALGFEAISSITLNLYPTEIIEIYNMILNGKLREAQDLNDKLYRHIKDVLGNTTTDWVEHLKIAFNKKVDFKVGDLRKPHITYDWWNKKY